MGDIVEDLLLINTPKLQNKKKLNEHLLFCPRKKKKLQLTRTVHIGKSTLARRDRVQISLLFAIILSHKIVINTMRPQYDTPEHPTCPYFA